MTVQRLFPDPRNKTYPRPLPHASYYPHLPTEGVPDRPGLVGWARVPEGAGLKSPWERGADSRPAAADE